MEKAKRCEAVPSALRAKWETYLAAAIAIGLTGCATWVLNVGVYPEMARFAPWLRELRTIATALVYVLFAFAAWAKPSFLSKNTLIAVAFGSTVSGGAILFNAVAAHDVASCALGCAFSTAGSVSCSIAAITALTRIDDKRAILFTLIASMAAASLATSALPLPDPRTAVIGMSLCSLAAFGIAMPFAGRVFDALAQSESARVIEAANPRSFLFPFHKVFLCALLFSVVHGFALAFGSKEGVPAYSFLTGLILLVFASAVYASRTSALEDRVFDFSVLFIALGLVASLISPSISEGLPHVLLFAGSEAFRALGIIIACVVGLRNLYSFMPALALLRIHQDVGVLIGAGIGHATDASSESSLFIAAMLSFFLCAFWLMYRNFSFSDTVGEILSIDDPTSAQDRASQERSDGRREGDLEETPERRPFGRQCARIGEQAKLTPREQEVFEMLAQGRNARYIMECHTVSLNTVKSHIKHVYQKLGIHSQQELIDLVQGHPTP